MERLSYFKTRGANILKMKDLNFTPIVTKQYYCYFLTIEVKVMSKIIIEIVAFVSSLLFVDLLSHNLSVQSR